MDQFYVEQQRCEYCGHIVQYVFRAVHTGVVCSSLCFEKYEDDMRRNYCPIFTKHKRSKS